MRKAWIFESDNGERMSLLENEFDGLLQMWGITLAEHKEGNDIPLKECTVLANKVEEMNGFTTYKRDGAKWSYHVDKDPTARLGAHEAGPIDFETFVRFLRSARCCIRVGKGVA